MKTRGKKSRSVGSVKIESRRRVKGDINKGSAKSSEKSVKKLLMAKQKKGNATERYTTRTDGVESE